MNQIVDTKLLGVVAFIMVFTYFAEGIMFATAGTEDDRFTEYSSRSFQGTTGDYLTFNEWINIQYTIAYDEKYNNAQQDLYNYWMQYGVAAWYPIHMMEGFSVPELNHFVDGVDWYENARIVQFTFDITHSAKIAIKQDDYAYYLHQFGYDLTKDGELAPYEAGFLESAMNFLGQIPGYFGKFVDLLTFNIKDHYGDTIIPVEIRTVALIFFIPLWIVMVLGILPIIAWIIEAIGNLIPFT
jgi:hypothetical protein